MFAIAILLSCFLTIRSLPVEANPELLAGGFEGDMVFPPMLNTTRGVGFLGRFRRWPNKTVPFDISAITNAADRKMIMDAIYQLMFDVGAPITGHAARRICVEFRAAVPSDTEVLKIQYGQGCSASVGYFPNFDKKLTLQNTGCFFSGIIQHELLHVLGFFHEQSRPDRDSYITVHNENIEPNQKHNFEKYAWNVNVENQGFAYDYGSIMHYPANAFSNNGKPTITPRQANTPLGQREKLSSTDIAEVRHYYEC